MKLTPELILRVTAFVFFLAVWNLSGLPLSLCVMISAVPYAIGYLILFATGMLKQPVDLRSRYPQ